MENAPSIILFWYLGIAFFVVTIALVTVAILLLKRGKTQNKSKMRVLGKICLALGIICLIPVIVVAGYVMYLYLF
ncbi:MAG: hypothetical protein IJO55_12815 [Lachnospiraceae bacterium]|nr:hypothetical protein [Lachnospiraceae bacterium]